MRVVALVSGGKDSCFNILHCLANGHDIVALANLRPANHDVQELDSFMFQTVGHDVLDFYEECTGLPMYRGDIHGTSKNQQLDYESTQDDEIEDLYTLLSKIKEEMNIEAVSVGAILSSYQRTRVENVCARLGLTSLAYLWQRDQLKLMAEMVESDMDARLIKVAAVGLKESHLGKSLKEMFPIIVRLNQKFEVHICGEGGEFETLVLDAPFFIKKLSVVSSETKEEDGGVAYYRPTVQCIAKDEFDSEYHSVKEPGVDWSNFITTKSSLLNEKFQDIYDQLEPLQLSENNATLLEFSISPIQTTRTIGNKVYVSNLSSKASRVSEQVKEVLEQLEEILSENNINTAHIQHSTLLVSSMSHFATINSIYVKHFTEPLPPSRVCVQTQLPHGQHLQLSVVCLMDKKHKTGLHVQGRSYWAPANIGPYSQAIIDESLTATLSGQIPLIPSNMAFSDKCPEFNAILALQHLDNVKEVIGCTHQLNVVSFVKSTETVPTVSKVWQEYSYLDSEANPENSLLIVQVEELPRSANVEWGGLSYKKTTSLYDEDQEESKINDRLHSSLFLQGPSYANGATVITTLALSKQEFEQLELHQECHYTIYTTPENIVHCEVSIDYIPVHGVWNYKAEQCDYGVVIRV
jgi:diphthine-ammonia ligase